MKSELKPCFETRAVVGTRLFPLTSVQPWCLVVEPRKPQPADPNLEGAGGTLLPRDTHPMQPSSFTLGLKSSRGELRAPSWALCPGSREKPGVTQLLVAPRC